MEQQAEPDFLWIYIIIHLYPFPSHWTAVTSASLCTCPDSTSPARDSSEALATWPPADGIAAATSSLPLPAIIWGN